MISADELLTEEAKIARIKALLPARERRGQLFVPDEAFYTPPHDDTGLKNIVKQLSVWLGFKPIGVKIAFSSEINSDSCFVVDEHGPTILVHKRLYNNAFACAALLAENLLQYYFQYRKHADLTDVAEEKVFIMLAVTYSGLGLVALNYSHSYWQQHYPKLYLMLNSPRPEVLLRAEYAGYISRFAEEYRIDLNTFSKYLCPWAWLLLPTKPNKNNPDLSLYVKQARDNARSSYMALTVSLLVTISGVLLSGYVISQRPTGLSLALRQQREEIDILKTSYGLCQEALNRKEQAYDQSDFFLIRNIEADRGRCDSLRNSYNYQVDLYNTQLSRD